MSRQPVKKSSAQSQSTRSRPPDKQDSEIVVSGVWRLATIVGGALVALYGAYVAWNGLGWWVPAGVVYVDTHIESAVRPIIGKVDDQGVSILSGRIETLKGAKQLQIDAKGRLDLQRVQTKDPIALQLIASHQKGIDETLKAIDDQIATLSSELKTAQTKGR